MRAVVLISGGTDSLITTHMLAERGLEVIGLHLILTKETAVVNPIGFRIPIVVVDVRETFHREVVEYTLRAYREGKTPNPCAICNLKVKFETAILWGERLRANVICSGHYARVLQTASGPRLFAPLPGKGQEYFLALLPRDILGKLFLPLGSYSKDEVIRLARALRIRTPKRSVNLCFLKGGLKGFLNGTSVRKEGVFVRVPDGKVLGKCENVYAFTVGQRRGTHIAKGRRLYVVAVDPKSGRVFLGEERFLMGSDLVVGNLNFIREVGGGEFLVKIRYRHREAPAEVDFDRKGKKAYVKFRQPQRAITPGQLAVFYSPKTGEVVAAGTIEKNLTLSKWGIII